MGAVPPATLLQWPLLPGSQADREGWPIDRRTALGKVFGCRPSQFVRVGKGRRTKTFPVPAVELTGAFAAKQNDGLPRSGAGSDFVFGVHRSPRCSASELQSGRVSYLAVHLGPQQSPGPVNPAFQSSYGAAGRLSGFFITLLLDPDQMKGFFLFLRQSLIGDVELANTGAVLL